MDVDWKWKKEFKKKGSYIMNYGEFGGQYVPQKLKEKQMKYKRSLKKLNQMKNLIKNIYII